MNTLARACCLLLLMMIVACARAPEQLLREAEAALEARRYEDARRLALAARDGATAVRERAKRSQ